MVDLCFHIETIELTRIVYLNPIYWQIEVPVFLVSNALVVDVESAFWICTLRTMPFYDLTSE